MAWKTSLIALGVGMGLALGDAPKPAKPPRAKPKIIDLDFTQDDEDWTAAPKSAEDNASPGRWIYWTLGAGVVAAGGVGWYLYQDQQEPTVTRNEQIFTDER
jgi:hypothetical protein